MSPKLRPLILPQVVEARRKLEEIPSTTAADGERTYIMDTEYPSSASSSDVTSSSPITPTFDRSTGLSRFFSASTSSIDLTSSSSYSASPVSPAIAQPLHTRRSSRSLLPDVQEDPCEREDEECTILPESIDKVDWCLCDSHCFHDCATLVSSPAYVGSEHDYDLGFLSDGEVNGSPCHGRTRNGSDASFGQHITRLGSKISSLSRLRSTSRRNHGAFSPSELSLDQRICSSRAPSSRSSSLSGPSRQAPDRSNEARVPPNAALSVLDSNGNFDITHPQEANMTNLRASLERDRAMATTPLLPPLFNEHVFVRTTPHLSSLQPPATAPSLASDAIFPLSYPTPPLSTKDSIASIRRGLSGPNEMPSLIPNILDHDSWSDKLGHANFMILPRPYDPPSADIHSLVLFREDWDLAKINYAKHIARTGEHYSTTSNIYRYTEDKWLEISSDWRDREQRLIDRIAQTYDSETLATMRLRSSPEDMLPDKIPDMLNAEGKFPERGDEDIVGPMMRDAVMIREVTDKRHGTSAWLRNLACRCGFRR